MGLGLSATEELGEAKMTHYFAFFRVLLRIRNTEDITNLVLTTNLVRSSEKLHLSLTW